MFGIRRTEFDITDERMFWECDPEVDTGWGATAESARDVTDNLEQPQAVGDPSPAPTDHPQPSSDASPLRDEHSTASVPAADCAPVTEQNGMPLPAWALEPDWTLAPTADRQPGPRLNWRVGCAAVSLAAVLTVAGIALSGHGSSPAHNRAVASVRHANVSTKPVVLASYATSNSTTSTSHRSPIRPALTDRPRPAVRSGSAHSRPKPRPTAPAPAAPVVTPAPPAATATSSPPQAQMAAPAQPAPATAADDVPESRAPETTAAPVVSQHRAPRPAGSSEFGFER